MILLTMINFVLIVLNAIQIFSRPQGEFFSYIEPGAKRGWIDDGRRVFVNTTPAMRKGVYTVSVRYSIENDTYELSCLTNSAGDYSVGNTYPMLYADRYWLDSQQNSLTFRLWLNSDIDYLTIRIDSTAALDDICVDEIYVEQEFKETLMYLTLKLCVILFMADIIAFVIIFRKMVFGKIRENIYVVFGLLVTFCICSLSVISNSQVYGHDFVFHLSRIVGLAEGLQSGNFPVRIQPGWNNGYGYAVSVFYGDLLLYVPALLYIASIPLVYVYKFYVLCINVGTIGIAYFCYKRLSQDKYIAVACTALYCVSINRIVNIFVRAAVGEYSATMFFPLVLLGMKEILCADKDDSAKRYGWIYLCIGMTGVLQTHILSVEMVCFFLGITVIALGRKFLHREIGTAFLKSIIVTICLNLGFAVPFLDYSRQNLTVFANSFDYRMQRYGMSLYELFSIGTSALGQAAQSTDGLAQRFSNSLGLGIIIVIVLSLFSLVRFTWSRSEFRHIMFVLGIATFGLFMSTYYFPWDLLATIPVIGSMVLNLQFPWRIISVAMSILVYMACLIFLKIKVNIPREKMRYLLAGIFLMTALQGMYHIDLSLRSGENYVKYDGRDILVDAKSAAAGEYMFEDSDKHLTKTDQDVSGQNVSVTNTEKMGNRIVVACKAEQDAYIEIPLFAYNYYRCIDMTTKEEYPVTSGQNEKIRVNLPAGYQGDLMVYFAEPWYWRVAEIVSIFTFVGIILYFMRMRKVNK